MKKHTGYKPFVCSECDYHTARKHDLDNHLLTHAGRKPFACPYCTYRARQKSNITRHTKICKHAPKAKASNMNFISENNFCLMATDFKDMKNPFSMI